MKFTVYHNYLAIIIKIYFQSYFTATCFGSYIWSHLQAELLKRYSIKVKEKGKAVPLQAWSDPEGSRKLRFPDFMTTVQDVGKFVSLRHRPLLAPGNTPGTHLC